MNKKIVILFMSMCALLPGCVRTYRPAAPLIPREVLFGNAERAGPALSPDGRQLAWLAPLNGVMNIWVRTLGGQDDRAVTSDTRRGIYGFQWRFDNRHILYGQDRDGDENWRIYQVDAATREVRNFTPWPGVRAGIIDLNHKYPDTALITHNRRDAKLMDVFRLDLNSGLLTTVTLNPGNVGGWIVDNDQRVRGWNVTRDDAGLDIFISRQPGQPIQLFQHWGPDDAEGGIAGFTADGTAVHLLSSLGADTMRLVTVDLHTSQSRLVSSDSQLDIGPLLRDPITREPLAAMYFGARREWRPLAPAAAGPLEFLSEHLTGDINIVSQSLHNDRWIVQSIADDGPQRYYLFAPESRRLDFLFADRPKLENYKLAQMQPITIPARDGLKLPGYLLLPPFQQNPPARPLPVVLEVHGGPWARDAWGYNPSSQWLANRGYAVLKVNFRGSTGYGKAFVSAADREWGAKMNDDLVDAKRWAVAHGIADPDRIAIMGGSYGGYATLAALAFTPDEFACGISVVGPSNLITLLKTIPPYWEPERATFSRRLGRLDETEYLKSRSPLFSADRITAPLMIAQGANDPRVKQSESDQIVEAMRKRGKPVEYLLFPDEGHGFVRPANRIRYYAAAERFLARHLGGSFEPAPDAPTAPEPPNVNREP